jgi:hypothetical protein
MWRVDYELKAMNHNVLLGSRSELLIADTIEDALRLSRTIPNVLAIQRVAEAGWCWV